METDAIVGCVVIVIVLGLIVLLVWWSRRTINWIARTGSRSARKIMRDVNRGG